MNKYQCPHCAAPFEDELDLSGRKVQCYKCGEKFIISAPLKKADTKSTDSERLITSPEKQETITRQGGHKIKIICLLIFFAISATSLFIFKYKNEVTVTINDTQSKSLSTNKMDPVLYKQLIDTYKFYDYIRSDSGFYLDSYNRKSGLEDKRISSASTGIGLASLAIAHELNIDSQAEEKVIKTLKACLNKSPNIKLERNLNGLYRHWFDKDTGQTMWNSEFSTIDTALLVAGATICRNTFTDNQVIQQLSQELWSSINWESTRIDPYTFSLTQSTNGRNSGKTKIFNEYLLLSDYVSYANQEPYLKINPQWTRSSYGNNAVLSDRKHAKLPLFTFQFPLYLSPYRISSDIFIKESLKAAEVDRDWWQKQSKQNGIWGSSAGTGLKGYSVNATEENHDMIAHLPAMYGFAPFDKEMAEEALMSSKLYPSAIFKLNEMHIPWRISFEDRAWQPRAVQGIDLSPLLFGLASMHPELGLDFFRQKTKLNYK
ncbi:hypothetical protein PQO01_15185 [Lentisphaera marina]|uniref:hypothetical protein n=1 Tax=Lentisphaera marina TaxID=1111041 RepID=UPI002366E358|nr:hypothetical protein [Lentisphaera marina]MDD7986293.1 hypothetical protein [Lentisphaera marina]